MSQRPAVTTGDRLAATLVFSIIAHGVLALGVGFAIDDAAPVLPTLDVILVQTHSNEPPDKADFLAQANQSGGGESETPERPSEMQPAPAPNPTPGIAPVPLEAGSPRPQTRESEAIVATKAAGREQVDTTRLVPTPSTPLPSNRELIERSLEMARLAASVEQRENRYAKRPKRKFVSANTREYEYAAYLRAWQARVERIGNLNYPDEARRRSLLGQLVLTVAVRRDGSVEDITIVQPSGVPVLDEAAIRTVRLAEPFGPLPDTGDGTDILHITRTWHYLPGNVMESR
ncbi:TonB family protein [Denitratimonas sp. CY0512]|uniref:energy transducer TonB n=1 Tax=Denitratimonas sp. CY0512 TaxID=3131940 RepID=UPI0016AA6C2D|nr:energy transducer TonB [Gammaproteobacteria bacterium]